MFRLSPSISLICKSRLTEALVERIAAEAPLLLRYFCSPHHQDSALSPIIARFERAAGFTRDDLPAAKLGKLATLLDGSASAARRPVARRRAVVATQPRLDKSTAPLARGYPTKRR